jgi:hypothetical protein
MNIWLITIGSSDIQLTTDQNWDARRCRGLTQLQFKPTRSLDAERDEPFHVPPRVLGRMYGDRPDSLWDELCFPLLDNFLMKLEQLPEEQSCLKQIVILLTDQGGLFDAQRREEKRSPYWQDTCELKPILQRYFQEKFPDATCEWLTLAPTIAEEGLDNWNSVLRLVQEKLRTVQAPPSYETVYVSHQASTPAISSAVQFLSLAQFSERVRFLVSNEYDTQLTGFVESSSYLQELNREKAKELLDRHDYAGVKELIFSYSSDEIKSLLEAAIQWNFSEFEAFVKKLKECKNSDLLERVKEDLDRSKEYWWASYESAYLAVVRLRQGNTVEAMFHSFRAVEGLLAKWFDKFFINE